VAACHQHGRHHARAHAPGAALAHAALHDVRRLHVHAVVAAGLVRGAAQRQPGGALHALHGGARTWAPTPSSPWCCSAPSTSCCRACCTGNGRTRA
jgi:hypothetical protein